MDVPTRMKENIFRGHIPRWPRVTPLGDLNAWQNSFQAFCLWTFWF